MTALATVTSARSAVTVHRRLIAATTFVVFGLIDILVFGLFAHKGDATFALALPTSPVHVPSIHAPAAPVSYILGAASILIGVARATIDEPGLGQAAEHRRRAAVLRHLPAVLGGHRSLGQ